MTGKDESYRSNRDKFDDPRSGRSRLEDSTRELRAQLARGEIFEEAYEERMIELLQAEEDFERTRDLEREQPPGELEDALKLDEPDE